ncbi:MAG: CPBP family intramembrane metalloprotease [Hyphomonadaceae bacterium]|nr:CPBP family intramembrane metalloprotease [Hyphomonadaceae bacterium]
MPGRDEVAKPFALWHVAEAAFLPGTAATFLRTDFLALAALLGLLCAILRRRSSSIWTAVTLHWLVVVVWQGFFGGPSFADR